jgi:glycosyltransferase involved in cell wall biosynthesis
MELPAMRRIVVDAYHFVGLNGGSGGSGTYMLSLVEGLSRFVEVRILASRHNAHHIKAATERARRLTVSIEGDDHAAAIRAAVQDADLLYAPFTNLPERATYGEVPTVTAIHDLQHRFLKNFFPEPERIERDNAYFNAVSDADAVLTFSQTERQKIIDVYGVQTKIGVVPHAPFLVEEVSRSFGEAPIDRDRNPYVRKFGRYILYPAVNWPHKNHYRLLEAFRFLCEDFGVDDFKLVLSGASCVESRTHFYQDLLDQPWAAGRVFALGFVSNVQLLMLMKGAGALAFPSMYEGFGIPMLEAMRLGTPVIASDLPTFHEWFADCYHPFNNPRDSWAMAGDLASFLNNEKGRTEMQRRALARSMEFSSRRTAKETFEFLSGVADEAQPITRRRASPHRDMVELRQKNYGLIIHILVDSVEPDTVDRAVMLIDKLKAYAGHRGVGVVWVCPHRTPTCNESGDTGRPTYGTPREASQRTNRPGDKKTGWMEHIRPALGDCGDVVYFDDTDAIINRARAIQFYIITQVDTKFHCFIRSSDLIELSHATPCAFTSHIDAARSERVDIDGFYVGTADWPSLRRQMVQILHSIPDQMDEALADPAIAIQNFVLKDEFIRTRSQGTAPLIDWFGKAVLAQLTARARISEPLPAFAYVETELRHRVGHHFALAQQLCDTAAAAGLSPIVGANRDATDLELNGLVVEPCFSSYAEAPERHVTPTHFADELLSFLNKFHLSSGDYVYLHMPYSTLIAGVLQVIATSRIEQLPIFLIRICSTDESFRWHNIRETSVLQAIAALGAPRRDRIRIFVDSVPLQDYFQREAGLRLPVLLNPINRTLLASRITAADLRQIRRKSGFVVFGYFGEARREKGFHLIPDIVEQILRSHGNDRVRFRIQISSNPVNDTEEVRTAKRRLEGLVLRYASGKNVELYDQFPDMESYYNALAGCDAMLMPYDEVAYKARGSGIALESLALGIPIIVAAGTDMATTFAGPGCIAVGHCDAKSFAAGCDAVLEDVEAACSGVSDFLRNSPLVCSESEYMRALLTEAPQIADVPDEPAVDDRPVAIWIGNDVLSQGCSAVYDAQRDFLRRQGFEIYNVYVPFPDMGGSLPANEGLEKDFIGKSLGWHTNRYDFGCYSWMLNQFDDESRLAVLEHIAEHGGSTEQFLNLNAFNLLPASLLRLVEARTIGLVCLNYVHLLPIVYALGLLRRRGTRVVMETHDIQAYQHAIRSGHDVDDIDKQLEISLLSEVDAVVAISRKECEEISEHNPWATVEYVLPPLRINESMLLDWQPGCSQLNSAWLDLWYRRRDLQDAFGLRTPDSLRKYTRWILLYGRLEHPDIELGSGLITLANHPHPDFPADGDGPEISYVAGEIWKARADLRAMFPDAMDANHTDRTGFSEWITLFGVEECHLDSALKVSPLGANRRGLPRVAPDLLEALILARPTQLEKEDYRLRMLGLLAQTKSIDVLIVASDHPANVTSVRQFIHAVHGQHLAAHGVNLIIAGLAGLALEPDDMLPGVNAVGEVQALEPLYRMARVVAVPTTVGSGTPIKVLDAFARGLCVSVSSFVDRALDLDAYAFPMAADAQGFAADIRMLLASEEARESRIELARRFSADHLQPSTYDAKWCRLAGLEAPEPSAEITDQELGFRSIAAAIAD